MMRSSLASSAAFAAAAALAAAAFASAAPAGTATGARSHAEAAQGSTPRAGGTERESRLTVAPAGDDLALVELRFRRSPHLTGAAVRVTVSGLFGEDYLASAAARLPARLAPRVLVLVVNRPSPLASPVSVALRVRSPHALGAPNSAVALDPFTRPRGAARALCNLPRTGASLNPARLRALGARGQSLAGFTGVAAVAEAYDAVCALPYSSAFAQVVTHSPFGDQPAPPEPPAPVPPAPLPPGCTPCPPQPGIACPLVLRPDVCIAPLGGAGTRPAAGAH